MTVHDLDPIAEAHRHWVDRGWDAAADGMMAVTSVMRAQQVLMQRIDEVLRPLDLSFARYEVLQLLTFTRVGELPMSKLGARLQVHPASVTSAVDRLERQGFVERVPNPKDGRGTLARVTARGRRVASRATDALNATVFQSLGVGARDLRELNRILATMRKADT